MYILLGLLSGSLGKAESVVIRTFLFVVTMPLSRREAFTDEHLPDILFLPHRDGCKRSFFGDTSGKRYVTLIMNFYLGRLPHGE
jgi:hypothetical protein